MDDLLTSYVSMYLRDNRALQTKNQRFNMWAFAARGAVHYAEVEQEDVPILGRTANFIYAPWKDFWSILFP